MKFKSWIVSALLALCVVSPIYAGNVYYRHLADSNDLCIVEIDSSARLGATLHIDSTFFPKITGASVGWASHYFCTYGIANYDTTLADLFGNDSGHVGFVLESSLDGDTWVELYSDTTMRTRFTSDGDSTRRNTGMYWLETMLSSDTLAGGHFRAKVYIYYDVDSTDNTVGDIDDTLWLDDIDVIGLDLEE